MRVILSVRVRVRLRVRVKSESESVSESVSEVKVKCEEACILARRTKNRPETAFRGWVRVKMSGFSHQF